jgi:uncharacterized protein HemX
MSWAAVIVGVVGIGVTAVQTSSQNQKMRTLGNQSLALSNLSFREQQSINEQMLRAGTQTERLKIMADAVGALKSAQLVQIEKNRNTATIMIIVGGLVVLTTVFLIKKSS